MVKNKDEKDSFKLSYESDGKMGKQPKDKQNQEEEPIQFFNITPDSE